MQSPRQPIPVLVVGFVLLAFVAACASESGSTTSTTTAPTTTTQPAETTTTPTSSTTTARAELTLLTPPDGLIVTKPELLVQGFASSEATVVVNGQPAQLSGSTGLAVFAATLTLFEGTNLINVVAEQPGTMLAEASVNVRYLPDASVGFAFLERVVFGEAVITDYAEFLTGQEAIDAAVEDGVTTPEEGVPNDYYIRNLDTTGSPRQLASDVVVILSTSATGPITELQVPFDEWLSLFHEDGSPWDITTETPPEQEPPHFGFFGAGWGAGYWVTIDGFFVVQIRQQWVP